jgi:hypothetical protein
MPSLTAARVRNYCLPRHVKNGRIELAMSDICLIDHDSRTSNLPRIRCKDEDRELQQLLLLNPHLLPSRQIDPENPPRWLLVKREMPVPDPGSGSDRWSVDFLFVDHLAVPTLVECKRCDDTRSRREVIAQMLEYAANGQHYWGEGELARYAAETAGGSENLFRWIQENNGSFSGIDDFFRAAEANLRESRIRLIFFLENSPPELRSLVDYLNRQLAATEVLLVEARLYQAPAGRVVVPWLFGYTEQARVAKRESRAEVVRQGTVRSEEAFLQAIEELDPPTKAAVEALISAFPRTPTKPPSAHWSWAASAILRLPQLQSGGLLAVLRSGDIELYFGQWAASGRDDVGPVQVEVAKRLADGLESILGIEFTATQRQKYPKIKSEQWTPHVEKVLSLLREIAATQPQPAGST